MSFASFYLEFYSAATIDFDALGDGCLGTFTDLDFIDKCPEATVAENALKMYKHGITFRRIPLAEFLYRPETIDAVAARSCNGRVETTAL